jgi:hypothetical protein
MFRALQKQGMQIYAKWIALFGTLGEQAHFGLGILAGGYFLLIATTAIVATFHSEAERRADARKVLKQVLPHRRRRR